MDWYEWPHHVTRTSCHRTGASSADQRNAGPDWRAFGVVDREVLGVVRFSEEDKKTIWDMREAGVPVKRIAKHLGRQSSSLRMFIADAGGRRPRGRERSGLRLSLAEREEISRGLAAGLSLRAIAGGMSRSASTICREVNANGGRVKYRALSADRRAQRRALRPKQAKLAQCRRLRSVVE